jgi:hypothetical protein
VVQVVGAADMEAAISEHGEALAAAMAALCDGVTADQLIDAEPGAVVSAALKVMVWYQRFLGGPMASQIRDAIALLATDQTTGEPSLHGSPAEATD